MRKLSSIQLWQSQNEGRINAGIRIIIKRKAGRASAVIVRTLIVRQSVMRIVPIASVMLKVASHLSVKMMGVEALSPVQKVTDLRGRIVRGSRVISHTSAGPMTTG